MLQFSLSEHTLNALKDNGRHTFNLYGVGKLNVGEIIEFIGINNETPIHAKLTCVGYSDSTDNPVASTVTVTVELNKIIGTKQIKEELTFITSDGSRFNSDRKNQALRHQAHLNFKEWYENNRCNCVYWNNFWCWIKDNKLALINHLTELDKYENK